MNLSKKQQEIVSCHDQYCYVVAGAGSGKTRTLTEYIRRLLSENKRGEKVLAVTFSNKAANELEERLLQSYTKYELQERVYVGTIHNFCMELVLQRGTTIGLSSDLHIFETYEDRLAIFMEALDYVPQMKEKCIKSNGSFDSTKVRSYFDSLSKAKRNFKFPADYTARPQSQLLYQEYNNRMLAQNAIDFDDILLFAYRILSEKEAVARIYQRIYKNICVDEAQDLNRSQYEVIKAIAGTSANIFMVGDPNQAIYGFNGSSPKFMMSKFPKEYEATKFELLENFRSARTIIDAAKKIEPSFNMNGQLPIIGELLISTFPNEEEEAKWIIEKLKTLLQNGHPDIEGNGIDLAQCAVLARNRYVFSKLEELLKTQGIDYYLRTSSSQGVSSESTMFKVFDLSLRLIINPKDALHLSEIQKLLADVSNTIISFEDLCQSVFLERSLGKSATEVLMLVWSLLVKQQTKFGFDKVLSILEQYCNSQSNFNNDEERLLATKDNEAWKDRWKTYSKNSSIEDRSLSHMMRSIALGVTSISQEHGLTLSTVHMSKGLEFDVVFIMGLNEGTFPDYRALQDNDQLGEERHNMFVSITRSRRLCYLTGSLEKLMPWGGIKKQKPSQYLLDLGLHINL
jgi:DNA helicase-2/ATP-dependent DNA helicase PcrA